jgi:hypothetical protein
MGTHYSIAEAALFSEQGNDKLGKEYIIITTSVMLYQLRHRLQKKRNCEQQSPM